MKNFITWIMVGAGLGSIIVAFVIKANKELSPADKNVQSFQAVAFGFTLIGIGALLFYQK